MKRVANIYNNFENLRNEVENFIANSTNEEMKMEALDLLEAITVEIEYFEDNDYQNEVRIYNSLYNCFNNMLKAA